MQDVHSVSRTFSAASSKRAPAARTLLAATLLGTLAAACTPTVKVEPPTEPITINLNIKIEQEVRIRVEKDLEDLFSSESDLFGGKKQ